MGQISEKIEKYIELSLAPVYMELKDTSESHRGHAGYNPAGESHFHLLIVSEIFAGRSRIERHRMVYNALNQIIKDKVHSISMATFSPDEYNSIG